ncbi:MAG: hypothetical protein IJF17_05030 [Thermoguttaceae bacterium]|nr:hypothetical protein [Thermoguttaceae bacterium]
MKKPLSRFGFLAVFCLTAAPLFAEEAEVAEDQGTEAAAVQEAVEEEAGDELSPEAFLESISSDDGVTPYQMSNGKYVYFVTGTGNINEKFGSRAKEIARKKANLNAQKAFVEFMFLNQAHSMEELSMGVVEDLEDAKLIENMNGAFVTQTQGTFRGLERAASGVNEDGSFYVIKVWSPENQRNIMKMINRLEMEEIAGQKQLEAAAGAEANGSGRGPSFSPSAVPAFGTAPAPAGNQPVHRVSPSASRFFK